MADNNRRIEYMAVSELMTRLHPQNPKEHDIPMIAQSFMDHGFVSSGTLDERTGLFLCGHGRTEALQYMIDQQMDVPRDINVSDGEWYCPVECGYSSLNDAQALAYIAIDNQATIAGDWNKEKLVAMLTEIKNSDDIELPASGFDEQYLELAMAELKASAQKTLDELEDEYGEPGDRDFWPVIKVQVSPQTFARFTELMAQQPGEDDAEKFDAIISNHESD